MLGVIPSGVLIAGGCAVYVYAWLKFEPPVPGFRDFVELKQHLSASPKQRGYVIVEGTVAKLADSSVRSEKAGVEGAARKVMTTYQGKTSTVSDISVPFLLVDPEGQSIKVTSVDRALRVGLVMEKIWDEPSTKPNIQATQELMLTFGTHLGLFGCALVEGGKITLTPEEVDKSLSITIASRKSQRRLLYTGSCILLLSGIALLVISFAK